jgi:hypothetical protein
MQIRVLSQSTWQSAWCYLLGFFCVAALATAHGAGVGQRFNLTSALALGSGQSAQVFVPDYYAPPTNGRVFLAIHLHGSAGPGEDMVYRVRANAVVFNLNLNGLSSVYQNYFADGSRFATITNLVLQVLRTNNIVTDPQIGTLALSSFSAGYAGIREILKTPDYYSRTDALLLADTIYSSSDAASRTVQMRDFLKFASDARDRRKFFLLTHSRVPTSGYDSTVQTADYLVSGIGQSWQSATAIDAIGTQYRRCEAGWFQAWGYLGETGTDHTRHFQNMDLMMGRLLQWMQAANEASLRFKSIRLVAGVHLELTLESAPGNEYVLEQSIDLSNWVPVSNVAATSNLVTWVEPLELDGRGFFRARKLMTQAMKF